ncbi:MAG TPA: Nudix family hydrolase [Oleiagrimonas sp.]|nr:Nudix family hydrolase [Oleiagrimonas sp.]
MTQLHVAAGALVGADGRLLLARRPPGKQLAGFREFPGGKLEPGESSVEALCRELHEELAIDVTDVDPLPLIEVPWQHGSTRLRLILHRVRAWQGRPRPCEGQTLAWQDPSAVELATLAPADRYMLRALRLPDMYPITPDLAADADPALVRQWLQRQVAGGAGLMQLRLPQWSHQAVREAAAECLPGMRDAGAALLLHADVEGALQLGTGVHLQARQLSALSARPLPDKQWVGASCHTARELQQALTLGVDFAVLSPVKSTRTHPDTEPMGWSRFAELVAQTPLPVYAMGGMTPADTVTAQRAGAQGVAGIRAFEPSRSRR